ncbi:MFS transporter [Streptomyces zagrosensis]|uniref:Putative MFS family arabinose efflux permease n=1 Tax=Streptomyces zagrosensis TaxID=1042984 RepID=A0A7W9Q8X2_9ACTN|nr:MFS transporter [Streptomyces zagrosensis]MBB5935801.1 putative MFS family arabinose efflux permease [Streptomyces zagrosensis]
MSISSKAAAGADGSVGYRAVFAVREFRTVFAAHLLSMLGVVICEIALSVLVYDLTGSPLLSALTFALGLLPYVLGGTLLSSIADRYPSRAVLVVCDVASAVCAAGMVFPGTPIAVLLFLRTVSAAIAPVFGGTRAATLGDILGEGDLFVLGRSVIRVVAQCAQLAGFGVGGLLLVVVAPRGVLGCTVVTFLCSALLLRFGTRSRPPRAVASGAVVGASLAGAKQLLGNRRVRALLLLAWVPPMFVVAPEALAAPYADDLGLGSAGLGLLLVGLPIGAITSEVLVGSLLGPRARERIVLPVATLTMLPAVGYFLHPPLPLALAFLVLAGCGISYTLGLDQWFIAAVPAELRGRAMTVLTAGLMTVQGLGMALAGAAAEFVPVHVAVGCAGVLGWASVLLVAAEVRRTRPRSGLEADIGGPKPETGLTSI